MEQISAILNKNGIKASFQRIKIYDFLSKNFIHPTADQVYDALKDQLPTLSKSTVYSTLKTFLNHNLIREITIEENEIRYDFNIEDHGHFKCDNCGEIFDFDININNLYSHDLNGFKIEDKNVYFKGICKKCVGM